MTGFWKSWMWSWCVTTLILGVVFMLATFPQTDWAANMYYKLVSGFTLDQATFETPVMRFTVGVLGAVLTGWGIAIIGMLRADLSAPKVIWGWLTASMVIWFVLDSILSAASGFALNIVPNALFLVTYLVPVFASGVIRSDRTVPVEA